ncbi:MAG: hypothetical protein JST51_16075 [Armatimonadetes bacterium]|nr:hypothetical protein [Armatimonadota bacterium]
MSYFLVSWNLDDPHYDPSSEIAEARLEIEARPDSSTAWIALGHGLFSMHMRLMVRASNTSSTDMRCFDEAIEALGYASELDPRDPKPYLYLGQILMPVDRTRSREMLFRYLELVPDDPRVLYRLAADLCVERNYQQAIPLLNALLAIDPDSQGARQFLCSALAITEGDDAADAFLRSLSIDPHSFDSLRQRTWTYHLNGQPDRAMDKVLLMHELFDDPYKVDNVVSNCVHRPQDFDRLIKWCHERLKENPKDSELELRMSYYEKARGRKLMPNPPSSPMFMNDQSAD